MISLVFCPTKPLCQSLAKVALVTRLNQTSHVQDRITTNSSINRTHYRPIHEHHSSVSKTLGQEPRFNPLGIEMLPEKLYRQVFGDSHNYNVELDNKDFNGGHTVPSRYNLQRCIQHLKRHDLLPKQLSEIDTIYEWHKHLSAEIDSKPIDTHLTDQEVIMDIPKLEGNNIDDHFQRLGKKYSATYRMMSLNMIEKGKVLISSTPNRWSEQPGWTRYQPQPNGSFIESKVDYPLEDTLVFDVETCMNDNIEHAPTLAVAFSSRAWYSWTSPRLTGKHDKLDTDQKTSLSICDLIPFKSSEDEEKLIIGHNVGFDRSFLQDQYNLIESKTKFLDTLSLHMCICGLTGLQRAVKVARKRKLRDNEPVDPEDLESNTWIEKSSLNNLADVYEFHCGERISKDERNIFIDGSMDDVRSNFQSLMSYCANDVKATFRVFESLFPTFLERFPHPVTLSGMLEMSTMYLPVNTNHWYRYIDTSQSIYDEFEQRMSYALQDLASKACSKTEDEYSRDVWLWDVDWSKQSIKPNKTKLVQWQKIQSSSREKSLEDQVQDVYETKTFMRTITPFLPGFPKWYRDICCPASKASSLLNDKEWQPGPCLITTQMRITPKLMQLTWDGYPLHFHQKHGWGYLVPNDDPLAELIKSQDGHPYQNFPIDELRNLCKNLPKKHILVDDNQTEKDFRLEEDLVQAKIEQLRDNTQLGTLNLIKLLRKLSSKKKVAPRFKNEFCDDVEIPGAYFIRLPHKNGPSFNVGNPLGKDFVSKMEDGTLSSLDNKLASLLLNHSSSLSYWKNNHKRIKNQMVVTLGNESENMHLESRGAILPRVIVSGTVTRRAVEPTWLTASNQDTTRIGSELKAMVQAPEGYCFVGADVDSQELWIASLMGDSYSYKIHGGTGLSYMTLRGSKSEKTDMHSKTASLIGITRSDAKVLNYARIYGAGQKFIERFLINTNNHLNADEAKEKAKTIFKETKGVRKFLYLKSSMQPTTKAAPNNQDKPISIPINIPTEQYKKAVEQDSQTSYNYEDETSSGKKNNRDLRVLWEGGTESATFNKLEEIASSAEPRTPVLECQISQALEPNHDQAKDFVTSRVNWVVQSSAVDFLHLVLVNMKWLFQRLDINGRFSISIHDEVRYLVREEDKYKAAFALHVSNLLVRAYFAYKLNMKDLPISVAFFSGVDIDKCLRKEVNMDCKSPSNPHGIGETYGITHGESLDVKQTLKKYTYRS